LTYNFAPGPAVLPRHVRDEATTRLANAETGLSVLEISHRGKAFGAIHEEALDLCRRLYALPDDMEIVFLQGGASLQFAMVAENFLRQGRSADYIHTGSWSTKAMSEATRLGKTARVAGTSEADRFRYIPTQDQLELDGSAEYVHLTTNNTIYGTQYRVLPDTGNVPIAADVSSDLLSRPMDWPRVGIAYGGAQKNAGIAGLTMVFVRRELLERESDSTPAILRYSTHIKSNSLYNTPPVFAIFILGLVLRWVEEQGGLEAMARLNREKSGLVYDVVDELDGFYTGHADKGSRSLMNATFNLPGSDLERRFCEAAESEGMIGLAGHRSVGGVRASMYNAMPRAGCEALGDFMREFARRHG